jgi:Lsr2 protein
MTLSATPMLIDNTGLEASETVRFGVDGRAYEIDLPARRATELRSMADRYIRVARKIPSAPSGVRQPRPRTQMDQEQSRLIRATSKPSSGSSTARAAQDETAATASMPATEADVRGSEHGLTDREKQELHAIADAAKPLRNIVAGRLCTKGLADRDTAGNWWLTDAGRRELTSA